MLLGPAGSLAASPVVGAERSRNLKQLEYAPMLWEYHAQTVGEGRAFFTYPRRNDGFRDELRRERALVSFGNGLDSAASGHIFAIFVSPVLGIDYRGTEAMNDTVWPGFDGGLYLRGFADSIDFDLDARRATAPAAATATRESRRALTAKSLTCSTRTAGEWTT